MRIPYYVINGFTSRPFGGNPAGVCPLDAWPADDVMQRVATENDLSETAFFVKEAEAYRLRWFAPMGEVDLCGHATLAAAHVLFHELKVGGDAIRFFTRSGRLEVKRDGDRFVMDLPEVPLEPQPTNEDLIDGLDVEILETFTGMDHVAVLESEEAVKNLTPNRGLLGRLDLRGVVVTARGTDCDYVCRCFAPKFGVAEDPVTGSAQCALAPYWADKLGKTSFRVKQLSKRGGEMGVELKGGRVLISGETRVYLRGEIDF